MIEKTDVCKSNPENTSATKKSEHIPSGFSMSKRLPFKDIENNYDVYRGKYCMRIFNSSQRI